MASPEILSQDTIPYAPFPENPREIKVGNFIVHEYVTPPQMEAYIKMLSENVNLRQYDEVLVNMKGGMFLFRHLAVLQGYKRKPVEIEYHRPPSGFGAAVIKAVPAHFRDKFVVILDDIHDSGGVLTAIKQDAGPRSHAVALVTKNGIPNQIQIPGILIGFRIDDKWVGGGGMDLGFENEGDTFRNHPGLVAKI